MKKYIIPIITLLIGTAIGATGQPEPIETIVEVEKIVEIEKEVEKVVNTGVSLQEYKELERITCGFSTMYNPLMDVIDFYGEYTGIDPNEYTPDWDSVVQLRAVATESESKYCNEQS